MAKTPIKIDSEIVKARNRARSHFRRESKRYEEKSMAEARDALIRAQQRIGNHREQVTKTSSIASWVSQMSATVLASLDITPYMDVRVNAHEFANTPDLVAKAMTDFSQVRVRINERSYDENDPAQIARLIALTKGLIYHEGGHILFTVPFPELRSKAQENGFTLPPTEGALESGATGVTNACLSRYQWCWNLLEDQRMECAVVRTSPVIERFLQVVILDVIVRSSEDAPHRVWPFLSGRTYLPKSVLDHYRKIAVKYAQDHGLVDVLNELDDTIRQYKRAKTEVDMVKQVVRSYPLLLRWLDDLANGNGGRVDDHSGIGRSRHGKHPKPESSSTDSGGWETVSEPSSRSESDNDGQSQPVSADNKSSDRQTGDKDTGDSTDTADQAGNDTATGSETSESKTEEDKQDKSNDEVAKTESDHKPGDGVGSHDNAPASHPDNQQGLEDTLKDLVDNLINHDQVNDLVSQVNESVRRGVPYDPTITLMSADLLSKVEEVRAGMIDALAPLAVQADPAWRFRQESGVFDPVTFRYRDPGDTDYWSNLDDTGATGHDLALSVVLDASFSMGNYMDVLSIGAMGIRLACDDLDIPCTISTFSDNGYLVLQADDPTQVVAIDAHGGTDPMEALEDLENQAYDKSRHLVVVFTDGEWSSRVPSFAQYRRSGMYVLGIGYGYGVVGSLMEKAPDVAVQIEEVSQLPTEVTKALMGYLL